MTTTHLRIFRSLMLLAACTAACTAARAGVVVVDPNGGPGGATLLHSAIHAAQDGDILLLRPGHYSSTSTNHPVVTSKRLALVVDGPAGSVVLSALTVQSGSVLDVVLVRGLHVAAAPGPAVGLPTCAASVTSQQGGLWFEDCVLTGSSASNAPSSPHSAKIGLSATSVPRLTLVRSTITGGDGVDEIPGVGFAYAGADALGLTSGSVTLHECALQGGRGGDGDSGSPFMAAIGGTGLAVGFANFGVLGGTLHGGDDSGKPGSGINAFGLSGWVRDTDVQAGALTGPGIPASAINLLSSSLTTFTAPLRSLSLPCPVREGDTPSLHVSGVAGDGVFLAMSLDAGWTNLPKAQGSYTLGAPAAAPFFFGTITDPSGTLDVEVTMPDLPAGVDGLLAFLQPVMAPAGGGSVLGAGTALVWIDRTL